MRLCFAALCFAARVTSEDPEAAAQAVEALLESTEEALPDSTTINAGDAVRTDAHGTEALSEAEIAVWSGLDAAVEEAAFALIPDEPLVDHDWLDVVRADNNMSALEQRCQRAIKRAAWQEARALPTGRGRRSAVRMRTLGDFSVQDARTCSREKATECTNT